MVGLIAQLAGFIVLICLFFPAVRRVLTGLGLVALGLSILFVMALMGFTVYRLAIRQSKAITENPFASPDDVPGQTEKDGESESWNEAESESAPDLIEPALRRRYPWRREIADQS